MTSSILIDYTNSPIERWDTNEHIAEIDFQGKIIEGNLPPRIAGFVIEWLLIHRMEIEQNWQIMRVLGSPNKIQPLE
jgi:hypothetical protein